MLCVNNLLMKNDYNEDDILKWYNFISMLENKKML